MNYPKELLYSKSHEWVKYENEMAIIGITDYAQDSLGDIVFINLPDEGDELEKGGAFADVESVKAVSDVISPVTGVVEAVNEDLLDSPEKINENPYASWLVKASGVTDHESLMSAEEYEAFIKEQ